MDFTDEVKAFRQMTIVRFLEFLANAAAKKGLKNAVCLFPDNRPALRRL